MEDNSRVYLEIHNTEILMVRTHVILTKMFLFTSVESGTGRWLFGYEVPCKNITNFQEISPPLWSTGSASRGESRMLVRLQCV